jgi:undecaprenyl-diphosphatase
VPILHAVVLGITQGLSEFLPISSSGHLILVPWLLNWRDFAGSGGADLQKTFDVALHIGTLVGAVVYFRKDLVHYIGGILRSIRTRRIEDEAARIGWLLGLTSIPGALVGAAFSGPIEDHLGEPWLIALMLAVFGIVLLAADRVIGKRGEADFGWRDAVLMGTAQAVALQPGVSRSGATMTAARARRFDRDAAARLSFLMSIPITAGAVVYKTADMLSSGGVPHNMVGAFGWGIVVSGITGFLAVFWLIHLLRTRSFAPFVVYRVLAAVAVLGIIAFTGRPATWL